MRCYSLVMVICAFLFGCKLNSSSGLKITNGAQTSSMHKYPAVVRIAAANYDAARGGYTGTFTWCTAVWVSDQVVLTAERCVAPTQYGKLKAVTITSGAMSTKSAQTVIYQSELSPLQNTVPQSGATAPSTSQEPLGLAALIFPKDSSKYHVPLAGTTDTSKGLPAKLIGYPETNPTQELINSGTILKYEGTNTIIPGIPFLEIEAADDSKGPGTSLAEKSDLGGPIFQDKMLVGIAVSHEARPSGKAHFNRYVNLTSGAGRDFLVKLRDQHRVLIRNLDGVDPLKNEKGADLDYEPFVEDLRNDIRKTPEERKPPQSGENIGSTGSPGAGPSGTVPGGPVQYITPTPSANSGTITNGQRRVLWFTATWCGPCRIFENSTMSNSNVIRTLQSIRFEKTDLDLHQDLARKYSINTVPSFIMLDANGNEMKRTSGFMDANNFIAWLN